MERRDQVFQQAMRTYEGGRLVRALVGASPAFVVAAIAASTGRSLALGLLLVVTSVALLVIGRGWSRGWLPGFVIGAVPFCAPLVSHSFGSCGGASCSTVCMAACTTAGICAGLLIGFMGRSEPTRVAGAALTAVVVGSLGCASVGAGAVVGMGLATAASSFAAMALLRPRES